MTLVSGCGSRWMVRTVEQLFDAWERYRLLATGCLSERNELEVHRGIVDACFERNPAKAVELLKHNYDTTYEEVINHFLMPERAKEQ
jgi:DNA-binding GntR family transcriptional regulator